MSKPYTTPDVYVTEVSTLPPSVVQVATAIPAFIGYVEKALDDNGKSIDVGIEAKNDKGVSNGKSIVTRRIGSMLEYEQYFGVGAPQSGTVKKGSNGLTFQADPQSFILYYALQHFYANGGGEAYIVAVGDYQATPSAGDFQKGIAKTEELDEVTLLLAPEASLLKVTTTPADPTTTPATPEIIVHSDYYGKVVADMLSQAKKLGDRFALIDPVVKDKDGHALSLSAFRSILRDNLTGTIDQLKYGAAYYPQLNSSIAPAIGDGSKIKLSGFSQASLDKLGVATAEYAQVAAFLAQQTLTLPPSAAIAGVYAQTDAARGVWKAPANVPLAAVNGPAVIVTAEQQGEFNVDATAGKSINVIRAFTGQGSLVWGARTLAGNSNEWRYINVRRLFNMVEESVKKATAFAMFEPNTPMTWLKVKSMIDSYLTGLWKQGALFGDTAEQAFFVTVGLGTTMTEDDINNGYMNIKIGLAAVRPAEFIELAFSHKSIGA
ncbi:phage tail protein [Xenophilus sp. AP218F]|nr:phage tail protein [Xenophilus sp. AP218F]